eukprot:snap_masked-scaffold_75-processed-gene-0.49-mRNA-1 protein AED:1.00 eAED:1.00 QI:0/-1/0/0/-1/1/1/0/207
MKKTQDQNPPELELHPKFAIESQIPLEVQEAGRPNLCSCFRLSATLLLVLLGIFTTLYISTGSVSLGLVSNKGSSTQSTFIPTASTSSSPTSTPSPKPTSNPSFSPTEPPTKLLSQAPSSSPSFSPTSKPLSRLDEICYLPSSLNYYETLYCEDESFLYYCGFNGDNRIFNCTCPCGLNKYFYVTAPPDACKETYCASAGLTEHHKI